MNDKPFTHSRWTMEEWDGKETITWLRGDIIGNDQLEVLEKARDSLDRFIERMRKKRETQQDKFKIKIFDVAPEGKYTFLDRCILDHLQMIKTRGIARNGNSLLIELAYWPEILKSITTSLFSDKFLDFVAARERAGVTHLSLRED